MASSRNDSAVTLRDVAQLAAQQSRLLAALWPLLRPGGRLEAYYLGPGFGLRDLLANGGTATTANSWKHVD